MRLAALLGLGLACLYGPALAQAFGSCTTGSAQRFIANAQLQASVFNTGGLFYGGTTTFGNGYLIPKATRNSPFFAAGFWLGGTIDGDLRVAAARYGGYDFWPGPLEDAARPPDDCSAYDRIVVVSRDDLQQYYDTGEATDDLRDWPHQLGAPVLDGDGVEGNYDLRAGDQPDLIGDVAAWWVMNDAGNDHNPGAPLGVEVRVHAFLYGQAGESTSPALSQTTFVRYEVINRGDRTIDSLYASLWADPDLGDAGNDYIGTDTLRNVVFVYNDNNEDAAYGVAPPAQGIQILHGPVGLANGRDDDRDGTVDEPGERLGATSTSVWIGGGPDGTQDPGTPEEYRFYMQGLWGNGTPLYEWHHGFEQVGRPTTLFSYPGDPVTESFWSEVNTDRNGTDGAMGDRRMMVATGPFELAPDSTATLLYAMPYGRGADYLQSVAVMRGYAAALQDVFRDGPLRRPPVDGAPGDGLGTDGAVAISQVRPNPTSGRSEVLLTLADEAPVRAAVYDALGRQLEVLLDGPLPKGETALRLPDALAPGTYVLRVQVAPGGEETLTFTVVR